VWATDIENQWRGFYVGLADKPNLYLKGITSRHGTKLTRLLIIPLIFILLSFSLLVLWFSQYAIDYCLLTSVLGL
jgi:hypothetical protein